MRNNKTIYKTLNRPFVKNEDFDFLENVPKITAYLLLLAIFFGILKLYVFFEVFLGVPIFQFIDASEIVLYAPSQIIGSLLLYCLLVSIIYSRRQKLFNQKLYNWFLVLFGIIAVGFGLLELYSSFNFYPPNFSSHVNEGRSIPVTIFIGVAVVLMNRNIAIPKPMMLIFPFILIFWISVSESSLIARFLKSKENVKIIKIRLTNGTYYKTGGDIKYLGRTAKYWYLYDHKRDIVRIIKDENVSLSEFAGQ